MATLVGLEVVLVDTLNHLIELDYCAIEASGAAIERIGNAEDKRALTELMRDHERHVADLGAHVAYFGAQPASRPDLKAMLMRGKVLLGALLGDVPILLAMRSNQKDCNTAYQRANNRVGLREPLRTTLRLALLDERRHAAWLDRRLHLHGVSLLAA
jgi:hypothetical protein